MYSFILKLFYLSFIILKSIWRTMNHQTHYNRITVELKMLKPKISGIFSLSLLWCWSMKIQKCRAESPFKKREGKDWRKETEGERLKGGRMEIWKRDLEKVFGRAQWKSWEHRTQKTDDRAERLEFGVWSCPLTCCFIQLNLFLVDTVWFQESLGVPFQPAPLDCGLRAEMWTIWSQQGKQSYH